jgi:hypothetical protein
VSFMVQPPVEWMMRWIGGTDGTVYNVSSSWEARNRAQTMQRNSKPLQCIWNIQEIGSEGKCSGRGLSGQIHDGIDLPGTAVTVGECERAGKLELFARLAPGGGGGDDIHRVMLGDFIDPVRVVYRLADDGILPAFGGADMSGNDLSVMDSDGQAEGFASGAFQSPVPGPQRALVPPERGA